MIKGLVVTRCHAGVCIEFCGTGNLEFHCLLFFGGGVGLGDVQTFNKACASSFRFLFFGSLGSLSFFSLLSLFGGLSFFGLLSLFGGLSFFGLLGLFGGLSFFSLLGLFGGYSLLVGCGSCCLLSCWLSSFCLGGFCCGLCSGGGCRSCGRGCLCKRASGCEAEYDCGEFHRLHYGLLSSLFKFLDNLTIAKFVLACKPCDLRYF